MFSVAWTIHTFSIFCKSSVYVDVLESMILLSCLFIVQIVRDVVNTSSDNSPCAGRMASHRSCISFFVSFSFSHSLSITFFGQYEMRPVSLNAERIVEGFNNFCQIDPSTLRNSILLKSIHPVQVATSTASACQCLYSWKITIFRDWRKCVICEGRQNDMIRFFSQCSRNSYM